MYLIEFAARLSGGYFSTLTIPLVYGYNLIENVIRIALGEMPELPPRPLVVKRYQANRFCFVPEGKIKSIKGLPSKDNNIVDFKLFVKEGDHVEKVVNHTMQINCFPGPKSE